MSKTCSSNITESVIKFCPVSRASFLRAYQRPSHYSLVRARIMDKPETLNQITMGADQHAPAFSASPRSLSLYGQIYTRALKGVVELIPERVFVGQPIPRKIAYLSYLDLQDYANEQAVEFIDS